MRKAKIHVFNVLITVKC